MYPVVILAGGLGTRVQHLTGPEQPKAMLPVAGRPFIDVKLAQLADEGVTDVVLLLAHGSEAIRDHVGDGSRLGLRVDYAFDGPDFLGTGGAVRAVLDRLPDVFWVTYGDTLLEVPMAEVEARFEEGTPAGVMTVLENSDQWETSNTDVDGGLVTAYAKGDPPGAHRWIDYGMLLLTRDAFAPFREGEPLDLAEVIQKLVAERRLGAFPVHERWHDIGTEEAWRETDRLLTERPTATG